MSEDCTLVDAALNPCRCGATPNLYKAEKEHSPLWELFVWCFECKIRGEVFEADPKVLGQAIEYVVDQWNRFPEKTPGVDTKKLIKAIKYTLDRIQQDPDLHYQAGLGTEVFRLLCEAEAEIEGVDLEDIEDKRSEDLQPAHRKREAEVLTLRRIIDEHGLSHLL